MSANQLSRASRAEAEQLHRTVGFPSMAVLVNPSGPDEAVLAAALDRAGFVIRPAYSFSDALSCLKRDPAAQLLVCPCHMRGTPWYSLKQSLPPGCRVLLVLPETDGVCGVQDEIVWTWLRRPCRPEHLRTYWYLFSDARKRIAENFWPRRAAHVCL